MHLKSSQSTWMKNEMLKLRSQACQTKRKTCRDGAGRQQKHRRLGRMISVCFP